MGSNRIGERGEGPHRVWQDQAQPDDFLAAEQVLISVLALAAGVFGIVALQLNITPTNETRPFLLDWRLWAMSAASLGMGLLGTRIMLRGTRETTSYSFPGLPDDEPSGCAWGRLGARGVEVPS